MSDRGNDGNHVDDDFQLEISHVIKKVLPDGRTVYEYHFKHPMPLIQLTVSDDDGWKLSNSNLCGSITATELVCHLLKHFYHEGLNVSIKQFDNDVFSTCYKAGNASEYPRPDFVMEYKGDNVAFIESKRAGRTHVAMVEEKLCGRGLTGRVGQGYKHWAMKHDIPVYCFLCSGIEDRTLHSCHTALVLQKESGVWVWRKLDFHSALRKIGLLCR